ncbi:MAG: ribosome silencing factor [Bacillota bacterium]|nr:ribosome silencing factor [Bacillota bacterium]
MIKEDQLVQMIAEAAQEEQAGDLLILDVNALTIIADYFVIASGRSSVQIKSIADNIEDKLTEAGVSMLRRDGYEEGKWVVLDYGSSIVHIFRQEEREYYNLENLWGDASHVAIQEQ